jgi:uncharacterized protein YecE (DUF72 family)
MKKGKIYIGTSGWHYKHWKGTFYPGDIKEAEQFAFYKKHFSTVEINNSFYRLPNGKTFKAWKEAAPGGFIFSVKASRYITHMKKLKADKVSLNKFFTRTGKLENKLGPILFQLPPHWKINAERLQDFLQRIPKGYRYTFEFRNESWHEEKIFDILKKHNCAFCIYELAKHLTPLQVTADFIYIRLHGPGDKYQGSYTTAQLKKWAQQCRKWQLSGKDVYVYFDNDQKGYAAFNAKKLKQIAGG